MNKFLKTLIITKALLLLGAAGGYALYKNPPKALATLLKNAGLNTTQAQVPQTITKVKKEENKEELTNKIPEKILTTSEANTIRTQLEFLRQNIESKTEALAQAKKAYDISKEDVDVKLKKIEEERKLLDETIQKEKKVKEERVAETLEFFLKMEPRKAAPIMESMDRDLVVVLLKKLPAKLVTKILETMTPAKATEFTEYYTKIRSGREYTLMKELGLCNPQDSQL